jgi:hypothetical protein
MLGTEAVVSGESPSPTSKKRLTSSSTLNTQHTHTSPSLHTCRCTQERGPVASARLPDDIRRWRRYYTQYHFETNDHHTSQQSPDQTASRVQTCGRRNIDGGVCALCACHLPGRPGPFAYGLHAYMAKRPTPDRIEKTAYGRIANHRIEELQTRQSALPESPIPSTHSNRLSL